MMTLIELQGILGDNIKAVNEAKTSGDGVDMDEVKAVYGKGTSYGKAEAVARLAKQMINNADVVLRTDKLFSEGKLQSSAITSIVGIKQ